MITFEEAGWRAGGVALGAALAVIAMRARTPAAAAAAPAASALSPDPSALHYRYPIAGGAAIGDDDAETAGTIAQLEARIAAEPSPFEMEELAELYVRRAQRDGDARDYDAAEAMARRSLAILRTPNPALLTLAKVDSARHDFTGAIALAREQLAYKRTSGAYVVIATAQLALGALIDAGAAADAAVALKPDTTAYLTRALVMQAQGRDAEAAFDFAHAAAVEEHGDRQGAARLRALWGRFLLRRGLGDDAGRVLDEALRIVPDFPLALAYQGERLLRTGHPRDAAARFEQAFAGSRQVRYLIDQARALELAGDRAGADGLRDQVVAIVRGELGAGGLGHRLDLVEVLIDRGHADDLGEAIAMATEEVARRPSVEARFQLARARYDRGDLDGADAQVRLALASGGREAQLDELAARIERRRGHAARAAMYAREADRLDPAHAGWRGLGMAAP
jgi:tetratricopeptide (TPR) repeat protein